MKNNFVILFLLIVNVFSYGQAVFVHPSNTAIYSFLDELANDGYIEINESVKPYTRIFILEKLKEASVQNDQLNQRQKQELVFYLNTFSFDAAGDSNNFMTDRAMLFHSAPHSAGTLQRLGYFYKDTLFHFSIRPIWGIRYSAKEKGTMRHRWGGAEVFATIGKHWGIYASYRDNNQTEMLAKPSYFTLSEGGNYKAYNDGKGGDYSEMRGGISYAWNWGNLAFVKDQPQWGMNYHGSNILSGKSPSFAMLQLSLYPAKWIDFRYFHTWLISEVIDSSQSYVTPLGNKRTIFRPKYMAANIFRFRLIKGLSLMAGNSIVYSDVGVNPAYLLPFMFYKSIDHTVNHGIDNQNSQFFLGLSVRSIKHLHLYTTLYIDEFKMERISSDTLRNFWSWKYGVAISNWPIKNISLVYEHTRSMPITYKHRIPSLTYETNRQNLGHYLRDNSNEEYFNISWKPLSRIRLNASYCYAVHGNEYDYIQDKTLVSHPFIGTKTWSSELISGSVSYEFLFNAYLYAELSKNAVHGFDADGKTAAYYMNLYGPEFYQGDNYFLTLGFNIGF